MSTETLKIEVLADPTQPSKIGTRVTYMPRDLLANCSFDTKDEEDRDW